MACAFVLADSEFRSSLGSEWGSPAEAYNLAQHTTPIFAKSLMGVAQGWYGLGSLVTLVSITIIALHSFYYVWLIK